MNHKKQMSRAFFVENKLKLRRQGHKACRQNFIFHSLESLSCVSTDEIRETSARPVKSSRGCREGLREDGPIFSLVAYN